MAGINFKKIVRKELPLIQSIVEATDPQASIYTEQGLALLHNDEENVEPGECRYDIELDGQRLGWVQGSQNARPIATLLARLASKEQEKRALSTELLGKYKEISLLFNLSEKILDCLTVREAAEVALEEAKGLLSATSGALFLRQDGRKLLESVATFNEGDAALLSGGVALGEGIVWNSVETGRGEIINDLANDPRCKISLEADERKAIETALICVPIKNKGLVLGAIALTRPAAKPYTAEDLKLITTLAGQAAGVINALFHEDKLKESRQNDLILRLSSQIHESLELNEILSTTVHELYSALHLDRCMFCWSNSEASQLEITTECKRLDLPAIQGHYALAEVSCLVNRLGHCKPLQINDVAQVKDDSTRQFLQRRDFAAFLAIPIQTRSGQIGVICCGASAEMRLWSDSEVSLLKAVTNQLAIALDQADLYDQTRIAAQIAQDKAQQLEATVTELQQAQLQLVQSEKMSSIGQMVAGVAHEINNPVSFIHGNLQHIGNCTQDLIRVIQQYQQEHTTPSDALQDELDDLDLEFMFEDLPKAFTSMRAGTERIREIVLSLRNFSRLDQAAFKPADIHEGVDSTLLILGHRLKGNDAFPRIEIEKRYQDLPTVDCYPSQLNQVFMNILANGIEALQETNAASPKLTISTQKMDNGCVQICISDNGPGIPLEVQEHLFDPFFTTKDVGKGTGLGLSISYQIITERHNGQLRCQSAVGQGTQFVIEIPIQQGGSAEPLITT